MSGRWGIFGGLFDPVHIGHLHLAQTLLEQAQLDCLLWVPSATPKHKVADAPVSFEHRVRMIHIAIEGQGRMCLSEIEQEERLSGYAIHTVRALKKRYPTADFSFIIGGDNVSDLVNWYEYEQLLNEIPIISGSRGGIKANTPAQVRDRVTQYEIEPVTIASRDIRKNIKDRQKLDWVKNSLPPGLFEYIEDHRLYR